MENMKRTATCGELTSSDAGREVVLNGWVHRFRDHGEIKFVNIRDRYGITQVVVDKDADAEVRARAAELKFEYCIAVRGTVRKRPEGMINKEMTTGEVEILARELVILTPSETLPFMIDERSDAREDLRLQYRFLDLRTFSMQRKIRLRHDVTFRVREFLHSRHFYEIETPSLIRSTPEGARDFLVPSRIQQGKFYALPQSPQLYKQILMVSGFDRYFQIAHCFRDEDARGDRQLEHTQIDIEMSFVSKEDVFELIEGMMSHVFRHTLGIELPASFPRLSYDDAVNRFGSDKPDLRFDLEFVDFADIARNSNFQVFQSVLATPEGTVKALRVPGGAEFSRKQIQDLEESAKTFGAKGLAWMKVTEGGLDGGVARFFGALEREILTATGAKPGDIILMVGDSWRTACFSLGVVRNRLGRELGLIDDKAFRFAWIVDFPLFEWNEEEKKWDAAHHMFTMPQERHISTLERNPGEVKGDLYDLVCNGFELASGSIRIHDPELQKRIFNIVGFSPEEAEKRFGFLLRAFRYGAPPHGGIAPGLDRLVMIMAGENSIREVIAFPKNTAGVSPMDESPNYVDENQLRDLGIRMEGSSASTRAESPADGQAGPAGNPGT
ncbi:MAG TPA: aspartate--tRNA ligase [Spirochaetia bacterium]|nr:aspartate--tRNA ligase [Spirochaetia bacterium]